MMPISGILEYCISPLTSNLFVFDNNVRKAICKALKLLVSRPATQNTVA